MRHVPTGNADTLKVSLQRNNLKCGYVMAAEQPDNGRSTIVIIG